MSKSLVLFLLFASITSAYAEEKPASATQKDGLIAEASDEQNINALIMEPIAVHPIVVEQTPTTAEQLAQAAYDAIASNKTPAAKPAPVAETAKAEPVAQVADKASSIKPAASTNPADVNLAAKSQPSDVAQATPASGSVAEAVTTTTKKVALDKMLFEQINTAPVAKSSEHDVVAKEKTVAASELSKITDAANKPAAGSLAKTTTPVTVALDKPLLEQMDKTTAPASAKTTAPVSQVVPVAAVKPAGKPAPGFVAAIDKPIPVAESEVIEASAQTSQALNVTPAPVEKSASALVAAVSEQASPVAEPKLVAETTTPHVLNTENVAPAKITLDEVQLQQASAAPAEAVLKPVAVSTTLATRSENSRVVRDEFFEKALPEQVNVAQAVTEKGGIKLTPAILALTETAVPVKLAQQEKKAETIQAAQLANAEPAKAVTKSAPGSLASAAHAPLVLDKTLLQQINTASATSAKSGITPAPTAMLAENTPSPEIALENGLRQNEPVKAISGLSTLPVVPVGRITKAQPIETKPAAGSLGAHAVPVEKMMANNDSSASAKTIDAALQESANREPVSRGLPTDLSAKTNLDKSLRESITAPVIASGKVTDVSLVPSAMLAMETPTNADATLLDQIPSAKMESVLGPKKPNNFSTAMIERLTGVKGVFNAKDNVYKISVPRDDLNIVVNGVKLTSAMGLTSWVAFKNTPDFTSLKGNLVLTEEQVNSVMFAAIENNLNVTELHSHYLWESPKVVFMHIEAEGNTKKLAIAVSKVLAKIKESSQGNGDFPIAEIDTANSTLSPRKIEMILGAKGALTDGVYKIRIAKTPTDSELIEADSTQGADASATFAGSDEAAVLEGDIAMQVPELQKVLSALHKAGISIVAINQRMINDKTRYVFLHYWGVGKTTELARGLRTALDASVPKNS